MNYKVGDKVRIRKDLKRGFRGYGKVDVTYEMERMGGRECHITSKETSTFDGITRYKLKEDNWLWYWTSDMFEENKRHQPIVIYQRDDRTVVALDKNTKREGVAVCSYDDEFDFNTGARLAFERLALEVKTAEPQTVEEKRNWLFRFCQGHGCPTCILDKPNCRCGCGTHFKTKTGGEYDMTDAEINLAYALAKTTEK